MLRPAVIGLAFAIAAIVSWQPAHGEAAFAERASVGQARVVEIRSYNLKPGTRDRFEQTFLKEALPMLRRWKMDVVAYGASKHDEDSWFLMRAFDSAEQRQKDEDAFYGSEEWKQGPRERILADIISYTTIVIPIDAATLAGLRRGAP